MKLFTPTQDEPYECTKAVKGSDFIVIYNNETETACFMGISDFSGYRLVDGEYSMPEATPEDRTQSIIDYNLMMGNLEDPESEA